MGIGLQGVPWSFVLERSRFIPIESGTVVQADDVEVSIVENDGSS